VMVTKQELTDPAYWDAQWAHEAAGRKIKEWHPYFGRRGIFLRTMRAHLGELRGLRVLDVGGGGANYSLLALAKWGGMAASAIDYSPVALRVLRRTFSANDQDVLSYLGDFLTRDPAGQEFDLVAHWGVLEHFLDPTPLLAACRRWLSPTGRLVFSMPNMKAYAARLWRELSPENWKVHVLHEDDVLERSCAKAGLKLVDSFYFGFPALKMADPERWGGFAPKLLTLGQRALNATAFIYPYAGGSEKLSSQRGFVATRDGA
jgi:2-polyprenyl-3-methyl-5-hydroxy-6-metoxy-1,4-benzoquinol methylase